MEEGKRSKNRCIWYQSKLWKFNSNIKGLQETRKKKDLQSSPKKVEVVTVKTKMEVNQPAKGNMKEDDYAGVREEGEGPAEVKIVRKEMEEGKMGV